MKSEEIEIVTCSFCGATNADQKQLFICGGGVGNDAVYICETCVNLCGEIIAEHHKFSD